MGGGLFHGHTRNEGTLTIPLYADTGGKKKLMEE